MIKRKPVQVGQIFGDLCVVGVVRGFSDGKTRCQCVCRCGNAVIVLSQNLKTKKTKSCGCLRKSRIRERLDSKTFNFPSLYINHINHW